MNNRPATPQEMKECKEIYQGFLEVMDGKDYDSILNILCFTLGELGVDLEMTKQKFIARAVEQISSAYDTHKLAKSEPEGEA